MKEIKDLIREQVFAEIIIERDNMILEQNQMIGNLSAESKEKDKKIEDLTKKCEELEKVIESYVKSSKEG